MPKGHCLLSYLWGMLWMLVASLAFTVLFGFAWERTGRSQGRRRLWLRAALVAGLLAFALVAALAVLAVRIHKTAPPSAPVDTSYRRNA